MVKSLLWHHLHITISEREEAAKWHEKNLPVKRIQPTKRSENLYFGSNLLQIQSTSVSPEPRDGRIESIGMGVLNIIETVEDWKSAGGIIDDLSVHTARVRDPWGVPFELIESSHVGYTHINISVTEPKKLRDWYEYNLGGTQTSCEWDDTRLVLAYDTMRLMFIAKTIPNYITSERYIDHLGWFTEDLDRTYQRLLTNNVRFPVIPRNYGPVRLAFAEDPCGNWIELLEPPNGIIRKSN